MNKKSRPRPDMRLNIGSTGSPTGTGPSGGPSPLAFPVFELHRGPTSSSSLSSAGSGEFGSSFGMGRPSLGGSTVGGSSGSLGGGVATFMESRNYPTQVERLISQQSQGIPGRLNIEPNVYDFTDKDLLDQGEIGRGNYGTVNRMLHKASSTVMAVKRIRSTVDEKEQKNLLMDLDVVMRSNECPYIVKFYGALFKEGDCWICMEIMDLSLHKFYKFVYGNKKQVLPEGLIGQVVVATVRALNYLKESLNIIHRDVKPSNILLDRQGHIKLCDFGISGHLVDSIALTRDAGCRPYMAPERIDPTHSSQGYDVRSDIWSLGITLCELATGKFPYPKWNNVFDQLTQVVQGDPPRLSADQAAFSTDFIDFVNKCLTKDQRHRPKYLQLNAHPFLQKHLNTSWNVAHYVQSIVEEMPANYNVDQTMS